MFGDQRLAKKYTGLLRSSRSLPGTEVGVSRAGIWARGSREAPRSSMGGGGGWGRVRPCGPQLCPSAGPSGCLTQAHLPLLLLLVSLGFFMLLVTTLVQGESEARGSESWVALGCPSGKVWVLFRIAFCVAGGWLLPLSEPVSSSVKYSSSSSTRDLGSQRP